MEADVAVSANDAVPAVCDAVVAESANEAVAAELKVVALAATEDEPAVIEAVILFTTYDPLKKVKFSSISAMVSFLPNPALKVIAIIN